MVSTSTYEFRNIDSIETRAARRASLGEKKVNALLQTNSKGRESYTIKRVAEMQEIWTVWDGDVLTEFKGEQNWVLWCWPDREFAKMCHSTTFNNPKYVPIPLDDFFGNIIANTDADIAIFPSTFDEQVCVKTADNFRASVHKEFIRYTSTPSLN